MSIKIKATIESVAIYHPQVPLEIKPDPDYVTNIYGNSYLVGYSLNISVDGKLYRTRRRYDNTLINDILRYKKSNDGQVHVVGEFDKDNVHFSLEGVVFPNNFIPTQSVKVIEFTPIAIRTKKCSNKVYEEIIQGLESNLEVGQEFPKIHSISDTLYEGQAMYSVNCSLDTKDKISEFSDLTTNEYSLIKQAILNNTTLKGRFRVTNSTLTLISIKK